MRKKKKKKLAKNSFFIAFGQKKVMPGFNQLPCALVWMIFDALPTVFLYEMITISKSVSRAVVGLLQERVVRVHPEDDLVAVVAGLEPCSTALVFGVHELTERLRVHTKVKLIGATKDAAIRGGSQCAVVDVTYGAELFVSNLSIVWTSLSSDFVDRSLVLVSGKLMMIEVHASWAVTSDAEVRGTRYGIRAVHGSSLKLQKCFIRTFAGPAVKNERADVHLLNCDVGSSRHGLVVLKGGRTVISECELHDATDAVSLWASADVSMTSCSVRNCTNGIAIMTSQGKRDFSGNTYAGVSSVFLENTLRIRSEATLL